MLTAIRAVGGAVNDVNPHATAYPHRHQSFNVSSVGASAERFHRHWMSCGGTWTAPRPSRAAPRRFGA
jgi:hypothetical protein